MAYKFEDLSGAEQNRIISKRLLDEFVRASEIEMSGKPWNGEKSKIDLWKMVEALQGGRTHKPEEFNAAWAFGKSLVDADETANVAKEVM